MGAEDGDEDDDDAVEGPLLDPVASPQSTASTSNVEDGQGPNR